MPRWGAQASCPFFFNLGIALMIWSVFVVSWSFWLFVAMLVVGTVLVGVS